MGLALGLDLADGARALAPERGGDAGLQQRRRDHEHDQRVVHLLEARQHRVEILAGLGLGVAVRVNVRVRARV